MLIPTFVRVCLYAYSSFAGVCRSIYIYTHISPHGAGTPNEPGPSHYQGFTITLRHTTLGRTPLDEWSARLKDLYLATHNTHNRQTLMSPAGFESTIPASERPQTHALDCAVTGIGMCVCICLLYIYIYIYNCMRSWILILLVDNLPARHVTFCKYYW